MPLFECFTKGSQMIEADTADEARQIFSELVASEPTEEFITADEFDGDNT